MYVSPTYIWLRDAMNTSKQTPNKKIKKNNKKRKQKNKNKTENNKYTKQTK